MLPREVKEIDGKQYIEYEGFQYMRDMESKIEGEKIKLFQENKKLKEKLSEVTMIADDEKQSIEHILELEEENKKLNGLLKEYEELLLTKNVCNENYYTRKEIIEKINDKRNEI